ncbi:MAG: glycoside hydrolase family 16 protein [Oscillospiraceae bacterium]|nr:glycoside hydrolase family 16 protein [Oscillospiraceae bacterium]
MKKKTLIIIIIATVLVLAIAGTVLWFVFGKVKIGKRAMDNGIDKVVAVPENMTEMVEEYIELEGVKYKLTFFDDFVGTDIDLTKWSRCPEWPRQNVGGYWDDDMITVEDGNLVITSALKKDGTPISGAIRSKEKFEQAKGYFEIRAKLQTTTGFWGAFWLMCEEQRFAGGGGANGTAKDGAEIDIFESCNVPLWEINHAIHYDGYGQGRGSVTKTVTSRAAYDGDFHTFSLLWTDTAYVWYIDGEETFRVDVNSSNYPGACEVPCFMKISSEFGTWAWSYDAKDLPDAWYVDYVKVYSSEY